MQRKVLLYNVNRPGRSREQRTQEPERQKDPSQQPQCPSVTKARTSETSRSSTGRRRGLAKNPESTLNPTRVPPTRRVGLARGSHNGCRLEPEALLRNGSGVTKASGPSKLPLSRSPLPECQWLRLHESGLPGCFRRSNVYCMHLEYPQQLVRKPDAVLGASFGLRHVSEQVTAIPSL